MPVRGDLSVLARTLLNVRFRAYPTPQQADDLLGHCAHARFVWNLALEQWSMWSRSRRTSPPNHAVRNVQLTQARAAEPWLAAGSVTVQQQALRDFDQAVTNFFRGSHRRPSWRKQGQHEGFRIVGGQASRIERLNRRWGRVLVPKVGWVKFRWARDIDVASVKSYRVTLDRAGRWHIAFALIPAAIEGPGTGEVVGVDRGVAVAIALSTGEFFDVTTKHLDRRERHLRRALSRCQRGSNRRAKAKARLARVTARRADIRRDFVEKVSTDLAARFDHIFIEDLRIASMTRSAKGTLAEPGIRVAQKAGLNRGILDKGWGAFATRLEQKAPGRVTKVNPAFTSQACANCKHVDRESRENQADFRCTACGHTAHADTNAARNIAVGGVLLRTAPGHGVAARGDLGNARSVKREPLTIPA